MPWYAVAQQCDNVLQRFESEGSGVSERRHSFWGVWQYVRPLRRWIKEQRRRAHGKCVPDVMWSWVSKECMSSACVHRRTGV